MKILMSFFIITAILQSSAEACKLNKESSWYWSKDKLITTSKNVYIATVRSFDENKAITRSPINTEYEFIVVQTLKGKKVESFGLSGGSPLTKKEDGPIASYSKSCGLITRFRKNSTYLIFKNSFNPHGYKEIELDSWYKYVLHALKK